MRTRLTALLLFFFATCHAQYPGADSLLQFMMFHKAKAALYIQKDGKMISRLNENRLQPLASTVKIMIAIEFGKQAGAEVFDENEYVPLAELDKYYVAGTDGNAHPNWLNYEKLQGHLKNDSLVKLIDVARGMIMFSSNANSEYLLDKLGFDNVKNNIQLLGLKKHSAIIPLVASLFMYQNPFHIKEEKVLKEIGSLTEEQYAKYLFRIHAQLKFDSMYKKKFRPQDLSVKMQKLWSDRLPMSTVQEYAKICQVLNNRSYFDVNTYGVLSDVLETLMENPANRQWLKHAGAKGGSTMFVVTDAMYATLKDDSKFEIAVFFNNLEGDESKRIQGWINDFRLAVLKDAAFRGRLPK